MDAAPFADRLCHAIECKGSPVVVGLDPKWEQLPDFLRQACGEAHGATPQAAAEAIWHYNRTLIDAVHDLVPAVKPQLASAMYDSTEQRGGYVRFGYSECTNTLQWSPRQEPAFIDIVRCVEWKAVTARKLLKAPT